MAASLTPSRLALISTISEQYRTMTFLDKMKEGLDHYYSLFAYHLPKYILAVSIVLFFLLIAKMIRKRLVKYLGSKASDKLLVNFINSLLKTINVVIALSILLYITGQTGIAKGILGAAGISAFVIGFAFKDIGENFLAGVILAFNRPFRLGDTVKTGDVEGSIVEMSLRDTHIKTFDGKDVYVPNGQLLKNPLYNYTIDGFLRKQFEINVGLDSDIEQVLSIIKTHLETIPGVLQTQKPASVIVSNIGKSLIIVTVRYWINTFDNQYSSVDIHTEAITGSIKNLHSEGITIPGAIMTILNSKDL